MQSTVKMPLNLNLDFPYPPYKSHPHLYPLHKVSIPNTALSLRKGCFF